MPRSSSRIVEDVGTAVGAFVLLIAGAYHGAQQEVLSLDLLWVTVRIVVLEAFSAVVVFSVFAALTGGLLVREVWIPRDRDDRVRSGPHLNAIVPVYRDADVLENSVHSLLDSDYRDLTITVVAEPDDEETLATARALAERHDRVERLVNGYPGSKAGAINYAVDSSPAEYFAVFDADERISPSFLPVAMASLLNGSGVFQGRRIPRPLGAVETLAYCERIIFHASYKVIELFGFTNCRSSSTAFTRDAFERVGGYDDRLTEDLDFAHKCYRSGVTVTQARQHTNTMEAPHALRDLWGQRKRWRIGQIEVLHATVLDVVRGDRSYRTLVSIGRMASSLLGSLIILVLVSKLLLLLFLDVESAVLLPFALVIATIGAVATNDSRDGRIDRLAWSVLLVPFIYPAFGVLTLKSLLEYALSWEGEWYRVAKTGT